MGTMWLVEKLHNGVPPEWFTSHRGIDSREFIMEARCWVSIIYTWVIPSTHDTEVTFDHALIMAAILYGLQVNVGQIIVDQIAEMAQWRAKSLVYPSLISRLCY